MSGKVELKLCPFCGSEARLKHGFPKTQKRILDKHLFNVLNVDVEQ